MARNITSELNSIARDITKLITDELTRQKLVNTGKLNSSFKVSVVSVPTGYSISIESLDYFKYLDAEHGILDNVFSSASYARIQEQIADLFVSQILDDFENI